MFVVWIPSHLSPPPIPMQVSVGVAFVFSDALLMYYSLVDINTYWDRTSKVIILVVDAGLNYYFLRTVKERLVKYHGLTKYAPLVSFNAKLMVVSIAMDVSTELVILWRS